MGMKVVVTDYRPEWAEEFEREAEKLRAAFGEGLVALYHVGSTAVPGLAAKPIIDILPVVKEIADADRAAPALAELGYEGLGEYGIPGRRYFRKGGDNRTHQLHVFAAENKGEIGRHLAFRDYMRRHPDEAEKYGALKKKLAAAFPEDIDGYCDGKDAFVKEAEKRALQESAALRYLSENPALFVDMSECVKRGAAEILYAGEDGVFLAEKSSLIHMLAADSEEAARALLERCPMNLPEGERKFVVAHGEGVRRAVYSRFSVRAETPCYQVMYAGAPLPLKGLLHFRRAGREEAEIIGREYKLESPENIEKLCKEGKIWCGFAAGEEGEVFVGFIGRHPEGSMGLLQVFPEYRRRGYGEELESFMIDKFLEEGLVPYAHIIDDNRKSVNLQKKLGYVFADEKIFWMAL